MTIVSPRESRHTFDNVIYSSVVLETPMPQAVEQTATSRRKHPARHRDAIGSIRRDARDVGIVAQIVVVAAGGGLVVAGVGVFYDAAALVSGGVYAALVAGVLGAALQLLGRRIDARADALREASLDGSPSGSSDHDSEADAVAGVPVVDAGSILGALRLSAPEARGDGQHLTYALPGEADLGGMDLAGRDAALAGHQVRFRGHGGARQRFTVVRHQVASATPHVPAKSGATAVDVLSNKRLGQMRRIR